MSRAPLLPSKVNSPNSHFFDFNSHKIRRISRLPFYNKMQFTSAVLSLVVVAATAATSGAFVPVPVSKTSTTVFAEVDSMSFDFVSVKKVARRQVQIQKKVAAASGSAGKLFFLNADKSAASAGDITPKQVRALFRLWNNALATGDSRLVASRYATKSGAILLPTVSDTPRTDYAGIKDYFDAFLMRQPQGEILEGNIRIGEGWAQDAG
jgi:hypothetical protein